MKYVKIAGSANHHLFRVENMIWVRYFKAGKGRLAKSLKTQSLTEARIYRDEEIAKLIGKIAKHKQNALIVEEKFEEFLSLKKGKSKGTFDSMNYQWELHLKPYFGHMLLDEVTETEWLKYVNAKRKDSPNRKFFNDRKYLSMFLHWLHRAGIIQILPKLEDVDPEIKAGKVYSENEIERLLSKARPDLALQIEMALTMGMRVGEILSLEWSQIDWTHKTIHLPAIKTKIRKARTFGISSVVFDTLQARCEAIKSEWVFPSPKNKSMSVGKSGNKSAWETCRIEAKVTGRFHDLRHTFLTRAFKNSVNPALICHYAGLSLEEATRTYLHFSVDDTRIVSTLVGKGF